MVIPVPTHLKKITYVNWDYHLMFIVEHHTNIHVYTYIYIERERSYIHMRTKTTNTYTYINKTYNDAALDKAPY